MVSISAIVKYRFIAFITHALDDHLPSLFSATLSSPRLSAARVCFQTHVQRTMAAMVSIAR